MSDRAAASVDQCSKNLLRFMTGDPKIGSTSEDSADQVSPTKKLPDPLFCNDVVLPGSDNRFSFETVKKIVELYDKGQSEKSIRGKYPRYRRQYIAHFKACVEAGINQHSSRQSINEFVYQKYLEARELNRPVHEYMLRKWGQERAAEFKVPSFASSNTWLENFKSKHGIRSRKVTEYGSQASNAKKADIEDKIAAFRANYNRVSAYFPRRLHWNVDQTGFNYEMSNERTLSNVGERDTLVDVGSKNKRTHSYTSQPMISRDGRLIGKLLLCLQEPNGQFGVRIAPEVKRQEDKYGNIRVLSSTSGKMTTQLIRQWMKDVLLPAVEQEMPLYDASAYGSTEIDTADTMSVDEDSVFLDYCPNATLAGSSPPTTSASTSRPEPLPGPSHCEPEQYWSNRNCPVHEFVAPRPVLDIEHRGSTSSEEVCHPKSQALLLADAWGGHSSASIVNEFSQNRVRLLRIPEGTTDQIQPLDKIFNRQYKKFVKRITEAFIHQGNVEFITNRAGIINMHSLIWNQFGAPAYRDMLRYAWHSTDPNFNEEELDRYPPAMVQDIQFDFEGGQMCEVPGCTDHAFIRCSHCHKYLCLKHLFERVCFHVSSASGNQVATQTQHTSTTAVGLITSTTTDVPVSFNVTARPLSTTTTQKPDAPGGGTAAKILGTVVAIGASAAAAIETAGTAGAVGSAGASLGAASGSSLSLASVEIPLLDVEQIVQAKEGTSAYRLKKVAEHLKETHGDVCTFNPAGQTVCTRF